MEIITDLADQCGRCRHTGEVHHWAWSDDRKTLSCRCGLCPCKGFTPRISDRLRTAWTLIRYHHAGTRS